MVDGVWGLREREGWAPVCLALPPSLSLSPSLSSGDAALGVAARLPALGPVESRARGWRPANALLPTNPRPHTSI